MLLVVAPVVGTFAAASDVLAQVGAALGEHKTETALAVLLRFATGYPLWLALFTAALSVIGNALSYGAPAIAGLSRKPDRAEQRHVEALVGASTTGEYDKRWEREGEEVERGLRISIEKLWNVRGLHLRFIAAWNALLLAILALVAAHAGIR